MSDRTPETLFPALMVVQHEQQHDETMLATLQLRRGAPVLMPGPVPPGRRLESDRVFVAGGPFVLGVDGADEPTSLDNERPAHLVQVPPFWIGRVPVSNKQWLEFTADGGYSARIDIAPPAGSPDLKSLKIVAVDDDYIERETPRIKRQFNEIFQ